jgi:NAD dependent epimerase/dehydratase family enzyme
MFGEMANMFLYGSQVSSKKIEETGFSFQYEKIEDALENLAES